jgi:hypothetical protein
MMWRCHLTVRIPPSQGGYTGSIPVSATNLTKFRIQFRNEKFEKSWPISPT